MKESNPPQARRIESDAPSSSTSPYELSREEINQRPLRHYQGRTSIVRTKSEAQEALSLLEKSDVLGFDTESRPAFRKGTHFPPSLIQLAGRDLVCIFQIGFCGFLQGIRDVLEDPSILKVGIGLDYDLRELQALEEFSPSGFLDLAPVARSQGLKRVSLRALSAGLLGFRISKGAKCSNWSVEDLRPSQVRYAATDAWVSREVFLAMDDHGWIEVIAEDGP